MGSIKEWGQANNTLKGIETKGEEWGHSILVCQQKNNEKNN